MKKINRKWLIAGAVGAAVLIAGLGIRFFAGRSNTEPVYVYNFEFVGMTEYWGDTRESYGPVSTDRIQTVFVSDTQSVTEILVSEGDIVQKGDLLMTFDTTLSELAVERKRLEVEKLKLQLEDAQARLWEINCMRPMMVPDPEDFPVYNGTSISGGYQISNDPEHDGSSAETALICWIAGGTEIDSGLIEQIRLMAEALQNENARQEAAGQPLPPSPDVPAADAEPGAGEEGDSDDSGTGADTPAQPPESTYTPFSVNQFYVIFKITQGNMSLGANQVWQGMRISCSGGAFTFRLFDAAGIPDFTADGEDIPEGPEIDYGSGYTAAQIAQLRAEQQKVIKELEMKLKMTEAEYKIMAAEVSDGNIYAETDGVVISVLDEHTAKMTQQPILKVSGGGGFYVEGSVSELEKDNLQIGQEVTVNDWESGMMYTGQVVEIRDFPSGEGRGYGMGNPNASQYPFIVFVDESADLREGSYVSVSYSASSSGGIYLQKPFVRTEKGRSFVYVLGANGRLEEREVVTGKSLWGSYTEILSGITPEDLIAFPYGRNVRPGAKAVEGDLSNLYGY